MVSNNLMEDNFDTMLDEGDMQELRELSLIRRTVMSLFKPEYLVNSISKIIDESDCIDFSSSRSRKIQPNQIAFTLKFLVEGCVAKYGNPKAASEEETISFLSHIVENELVDTYLTNIHEAINQNQEYLDTLDDKLRDLVIFKDDIRDNSIIEILTISSIFSVTISDDFKLAHIEYMR